MKKVLLVVIVLLFAVVAFSQGRRGGPTTVGPEVLAGAIEKSQPYMTLKSRVDAQDQAISALRAEVEALKRLLP